MTLTKEEAMKQKPPEDVLEELKKIEIKLNIPHRKIKEAFLDYLLDAKLNYITDYNERCKEAFRRLTEDISNPLHFRDKYAYPVPIFRELVISYAIIENKSIKGFVTTQLKPIISNNTKPPKNGHSSDATVLESEGLTCETKSEIITGFIPAPFPTYQISADIGSELMLVLGYEHPTLTPPNWARTITAHIKVLMANTENEEVKKYLQDLIKDFL